MGILQVYIRIYRISDARFRKSSRMLERKLKMQMEIVSMQT